MNMFSRFSHIPYLHAKLRILLTIASLAPMIFIAPSVLASSLFQKDDPAAQCAKGVELYLDDKGAEALPLLEAGFANRDKATFTEPDDLGYCALALGNLLGANAEALVAYQTALNVFQESNNSEFERITLSYMGTLYLAQGRYTEALQQLLQALEIARKVGDRKGEGGTLHNIGAVYLGQEQYAKALEYYQQALSIEREVGDRAAESATLNDIGSVYQSQGHYAKALESYQTALAIAQEVGDQAGVGITLNNVGLLYQAMGQYADALDSYQKALAITREGGDRENEGAVLNGIGMVFEAQGRYAEALELFQQALAITREVGNRARESITLSNIGAVYDSQGRYAEALEYYQQALGINREVGDRAGERTMMNNIGEVYSSQGRYTEALEYYQQALVINQEVGDRAGEGTMLNNIGEINSSQARYSEALEYFQEALRINQEVGNRAGEGITLTSIGLVYEAQGRYALALESYQQALVINQQVGNRASEGATLHNIGIVYEAQGRYTEALEYYQEALKIDREVGNPKGEGMTLGNIGVVYEAQRQYVEALGYYEKAIDIFETLRSSAGSETARSAFIAQYSKKYDRTVTLYIQENLPEKAFLIAERGRSRAFLDSLATGYVELSDTEAAALYNHEQEAYTTWQNAQDILAKAKAQNPPDENLIANLELQLTQDEAAYQVALDAIAARHDQLSQLIPARNTVLDVKQTQVLLDNQTSMLSFWVTDEQTFVFVLTQNSLDVVTLDISRGDLHNQIVAFRTFANIAAVYPDSSVDLYKSIIEPLKPYLQNPHLIIIPHGELNYLPFAALTDGSRFLLDDYVITYLPSASTLSFIQQNAQTTGGQPLIIGNPSTGDYDITTSLTTERDQLGPLLFAEQEAKDIASLLGTKPYIGNIATETLVKQNASQVNVLHLAAHSMFNPVASLNSLIALAPDKENDGWLTVSEVYGLDLSNTNMVVLSACETQIGELTAGDEFVGLTRAFFFAGAPTVTASLWNVDDKATSMLMERFYAHLKEGMGKGEALQQAQIDTREQYPNPYYWAAFVLSGDGGEVTNISVSKMKSLSSILFPSILVSMFCCGGIALSIILIFIVRFLKTKRNS